MRETHVSVSVMHLLLSSLSLFFLSLSLSLSLPCGYGATSGFRPPFSEEFANTLTTLASSERESETFKPTTPPPDGDSDAPGDRDPDRAGGSSYHDSGFVSRDQLK